jgi:transketolase
MSDKKLFKRLLEISYKHQLHHIGSYFSCLDIVDEIFSKMNEDDIFILSNGHAAMSLYVVIEKYFGFDAEKLLMDLGQHPKRDEERKVFCSTGSLGMGITAAVGRAYINRNRDVYCLISDGECSEGSVWESLQFAHEQNLDNLKIFVNANGFAAYREVDLDWLERKIKVFHPKVNFKRTTVEYFGLNGISAHYDQISEEEYVKAIELL